MDLFIIAFIMILICIFIYVALDHFKSVKNEENFDKDELIEKLVVVQEETDDNILSEMIEELIVKKAAIVNAVERNVLGNEYLLEEEERFLKKYNLTEEDKKKIINEFETYVWGYGPLQPLIDDDDISDISIIDENEVRIKVIGHRKTSDVKFRSKKALNNYINYIALKNKITLSEINSLPLATDTKSSDKFILRIDISNKFVNCGENSYLHIRKIPKFKDDLEALASKKMLNGDIQKYLVESVKNKLQILICGKGGSGKTSLMNALIDLIPYDCSGLVVQESEELFSNKHPDLRFQKVIMSKGEGDIHYDLSTFIKNYSLVTDLDYIIVGEIKGEEAWDTINASFTGHTFMGSLHVLNADEALLKMVHYMKYSPYAKDMTRGELMEMLTGIDLVIFMNDFKINEITEIAGFDSKEEKPLLHPVFKYEKGEFKRLNDSCTKIKRKLEENSYEASL